MGKWLISLFVYKFPGICSLLSLLTFLLVLSSPTQLGKHWWPDWSLVNGIRIDYLSPTVYATDLFLLVLLLLLIVIKERHFLRLLLFALLLLPFSFFSPRPTLALYWLFRYLEIPIVAYVVYRAGKNSRVIIPTALSIGIFFSVSLGAMQMITGKTSGLFWIFGERSFDRATPGVSTVSFLGEIVLRPYATFPHPNALAGWLALSFFFLPTVHTAQRKHTFTRVVALVGVILSASRTALFSMVLALIPLHYAHFSFFTFANRSIEERFVLANAAWQMVLDHPLFGVGPGQFLVTLPEYLPTETWILQPVHNAFLLLLSEFGVVGMIISLICLILLMRHIRPIWHIRQIWPLLIVLFITSMGDHYWLTAQQNRILLGVVIGMIVKNETVGKLKG